MRLATFVGSAGRPIAGIVAQDNTVIPVSQLVTDGPDSVLGVIDGGPQLWARLGAASRESAGGEPLGSVRLLAPIPRPRRNVFCVGWNYSEHFAEGQGIRGTNDDAADLPEWPTLFDKNPATVVGPDAPVWHSAPISDQLDYEVELAVIIGRGGQAIPEEHALSYIFGYTIANDVSVRDIQRRHGGQWLVGKNFDTHCPMGPWIVTADEIPDPHALRLSTTINGVVKQDSNTRFQVFRIPRVIHDLTLALALEPGDIILTGTPEGVGFARKPPEFLAVGDVMELEVERIGVLRNRIAVRPTTL